MSRIRDCVVVLVMMASVFINGCVMAPKLFIGATDPLEEYTLEGEGRDKILLIPVRGIISDFSRKGRIWASMTFCNCQ